MAADNSDRPVVIRRVKKVVGGGHHGGAWKVAYADFVTAMMAFFMLLWLISNPDKEKLKGLAEYFTPGPPSAPQATGSTAGPSETQGAGGYTMRSQSDSRDGTGTPSVTAASEGAIKAAPPPSPTPRISIRSSKTSFFIRT
jgi:chemotaxis protein MotB